MPDSPIPDASQAVITGLESVERLLVQAFEQLHSQEHFWEKAEYPKLEKVWDEANRDAWKLHHVILKRLFKLGATPDGVTEDETEAFRKALALWQNIHAACQTVYDAADEADDYVTIAKLQDVQTEVESWIVYLQARLDQITKLSPSEFMSEQM